MIQQFNAIEQSENVFIAALKELKILELLCRANIRKSCGIPVFSVLQPLLLLVFTAKICINPCIPSTTTILCLKVCFIAFSANPPTTGTAFVRVKSMTQKPAATLQMISEALGAGIKADYLLADTWFITEPFISALQEVGLHVIGMVKQLKQVYRYKGRKYTLPQLACIALSKNASKLYWSIVVHTGKQNIPVRIVFVKNRNKISEHLFLLTTDLTLSVEEVIRIYGNWWSIETFFKASKSLFKLETEFQTRDYGSGVAHTALVFTRYIVLEWIRRHNNDPKTYGGLFLAMCEDVQDMELSTALKSLMALFANIIRNYAHETTETIKSKVRHWIDSQSRYIKALFTNFCWES